jgi:hypothetical protein
MGGVIRTTNGGASWSQQSVPFGFHYDVSFVNDSVGTIVGSEIVRTTDGGITWVVQKNFIGSSGASIGLKGVYFIDANNGTAVGDCGAILRTTNGGVTFFEEKKVVELPTEFILSQNYPNPFNPSTKIQYSVPQSSSVVIKVFDILGNEIQTLVNDEKPAGTYEITWHATNLPSGLYFYQLKVYPANGGAGSYSETKKMILIR